MKATRQTIPGLIERREPFENTSGTVRGIKHPTREHVRRILVDPKCQLDEAEGETLRAHSELSRLTYMVMSYQTPIAWENAQGYVYKVRQGLSQTSTQHKQLLSEFKGKES